MKEVLKGLALFWCFVVCVSCSSSGGSSPSTVGTPEPPPPITYTGRTDPVVINEGTAYDAALLFIDHLYLIEIVESMWTDMNEIWAAGSPTVQEVVDGPQGGSLSLYAYEKSATLYLELKFDRFQSDGVTIDGEIKQSARLDRLNGTFDTGSPVVGKLELHNLNTRVDGEDITLSGVMQFLEGGSDAWVLNVVAKDNVTDEMIKLENYRYTRSANPAAPFYYYAFTGTALHSEEGKIIVESSVPFELLQISNLRDGNETWQAGDGELVLEGDRSLKLVSRNRRYVTLLLDNDDDGIFETGRRFEWREVSGLEPEFDRNSLPRIGAVAETIVPVAIGSPLKVSAVLSQARTDEFLTYRWEKVYAPAKSTAPTLLSGPYLDFVPDQVGTYVYDLIVTQGSLTDSERVVFTIQEKSDAANSRADYFDHGANIVVVDELGDKKQLRIYVDSLVQAPEVPEGNTWAISAYSELDTKITLNQDDALVATLNAEELIFGRYHVNLPFNAFNSLDFDVWSPWSQWAQVDLVDGRFDGVIEFNQTIHKDVNGDQILDVALVNSWLTELKVLKNFGTKDEVEANFELDRPHSIVAIDDQRTSALTLLSRRTNDISMNVVKHELHDSDLMSFGLGTMVHNCKTYKVYTPILLADVTGNSQLDVVSFSPCNDSIYSWSGEQLGAAPQILYQFSDSDAWERRMVVVPSKTGGRDLIYVLLDEKVSLLQYSGTGYQESRVDLPDGIRALDLLKVTNHAGKNVVFLMAKNLISHDEYIYEIKQESDEVMLGSGVLMQSGKNGGVYNGVVSGTLGDFDMDGSEDLMTFYSGKVLWVPNYEHPNKARVILCCDVLSLENWSSVSMLDVNKDGKSDVVVGHRVFISPANFEE